jgi:hypothetical protein
MFSAVDRVTAASLVIGRSRFPTAEIPSVNPTHAPVFSNRQCSPEMRASRKACGCKSSSIMRMQNCELNWRFKTVVDRPQPRLGWRVVGIDGQIEQRSVDRSAGDCGRRRRRNRPKNWANDAPRTRSCERTELHRREIRSLNMPQRMLG